MRSASGVHAEIEYWKGRLSRFASLAEQLRAREMKVVLGVLGTTRSLSLRRWKALEPQLHDLTNEAKDNVKYLTTLEKFVEPLTEGTPASIAELLPSFLACVKMMHAISRYRREAHPNPAPLPPSRGGPEPCTPPWAEAPLKALLLRRIPLCVWRQALRL